MIWIPLNIYAHIHIACMPKRKNTTLQIPTQCLRLTAQHTPINKYNMALGLPIIRVVCDWLHSSTLIQQKWVIVFYGDVALVVHI